MIEVDCRNYTAEEVTCNGLLGMLAILKGRNVVDEANLQNANDLESPSAPEWNGYKLFRGYGCGVDSVKDAVVLDDGKVFACIASHEFAGTFATHENVHVNYYILTPKPKQEE